jgi:hypothetical protein
MELNSFKYHWKHLIKYFCLPSTKFYGVLQPATDTFWLRKGDITFPEYEWKIRGTINTPTGWDYSERIPKMIHVLCPKTGRVIDFKISYFYTTEMDLEKVKEISGELSLATSLVEILEEL